MKPHVTPLRVYVGVFVALLVLTALTTWISFQDLGAFSTPVALVIAGCGGPATLRTAASAASPSAVASVSPPAAPSASPSQPLSQPPSQAAASPGGQLGLSGILGSVTGHLLGVAGGA